ncbi:hypothetical protein EYF80_004478 [Liparis tanakae]|uniref:Secreted protein n=1 Tax=Liparis tanakae TaxID=230148 RepID=A0A4Z2J645_9TELE|nr:hypothetical protein EYF80_004478 [Liparis tanakae]
MLLALFFGAVFRYCHLHANRLPEVRLLGEQPLPGSCQSLSATSSILLTLCKSPARAIGQSSGNLITS